MKCPTCQGRKKTSGDPAECATCDSTGSVPDASDLEDLPEDIEDGFVDDEYEEV